MHVFKTHKVLNPGKGYSCVFRNWRAKSHCRFWHGYDLIFAITLECTEPSLTEEGWVYDFGQYGYLKDRLDKHFDHKFIVAEDDPELEWAREGHARGILDLVVMPSVGAESFTVWLAAEATDMLQESGRLDKVNVSQAYVYETQANSAAFMPSRYGK